MFQKVIDSLKKIWGTASLETVLTGASHLFGSVAYAVVQSKAPQIVVEEIYTTFTQAHGRAKFLSDVFKEEYLVVRVDITPVVWAD
jgi:hypothetical protein